MAAMCLHNVMRTRYPALQNHDMDHTDDQGNEMSGALRNETVLQDVAEAGRGYMVNRGGKRMRAYLMHYNNNDGGREITHSLASLSVKPVVWVHTRFDPLVSER